MCTPKISNLLGIVDILAFLTLKNDWLILFHLYCTEHPFYIMMNSFLLQRPALDLKDLPLFYNMFNSSTMQVGTLLATTVTRIPKK